MPVVTELEVAQVKVTVSPMLKLAGLLVRVGVDGVTGEERGMADGGIIKPVLLDHLKI